MLRPLSVLRATALLLLNPGPDHGTRLLMHADMFFGVGLS